MPRRPEPLSPAETDGTRRSRNARGEGERLRTEIMDAMVRLIADEERTQPVPLSLREVAREAGITAPAIYRHFTDKADLTRAVLDRLFAELAARMDRADADAVRQGPAARLAAVAHAYCCFAQENPGCFRVMFAATPFGTGPAGIAARWREAVVRLAETGMRLTQTADDAALSVWSSVHGRLALDGAAASVSPRADTHAFVDGLVHSLATVEAKGE